LGRRIRWNPGRKIHLKVSGKGLFNGAPLAGSRRGQKGEKGEKEGGGGVFWKVKVCTNELRTFFVYAFSELGYEGAYGVG